MRENRILKFRAWDGKTMHNRVEELYLHPRETINIDNGEKTVFDVVLMQFTGLHDVKGVDVYEGDIVKGKEGLTYKVFYHDAYPAYAVECIEHPRNIWMMIASGFSQVDWKAFTVIGNRFEHPELLKEEK